VVTLLVSPNDAERVTLAAAQGTVHFVLRNGSDHEHVDDSPAQVSELGGAVKPVAPRVRKIDKVAAPVDKPYAIQIIAGGKQTTELFK
jgi:pilus assembly protein CpaB